MALEILPFFVSLLGGFAVAILAVYFVGKRLCGVHGKMDMSISHKVRELESSKTWLSSATDIELCQAHKSELLKGTEEVPCKDAVDDVPAAKPTTDNVSKLPSTNMTSLSTGMSAKTSKSSKGVKFDCPDAADGNDGTAAAERDSLRDGEEIGEGESGPSSPAKPSAKKGGGLRPGPRKTLDLKGLEFSGCVKQKADGFDHLSKEIAEAAKPALSPRPSNAMALLKSHH